MNQDYGILLVGASGRMGTEIISAVGRRNVSGQQLKVVGGIVHADDPLFGTRLPGIEHPLSDHWQDAYSDAEVIIDFSSPSGAAKTLTFACEKKLALLECSTGLTADQETSVADAAKTISIVRARNTSIGIAVLSRLVFEAARLVPESFDIELVELHHRYKVDSPSGTALHLLEEAARAKGKPLREVLRSGRHGDSKRGAGDIGAQAVRGGDVAGEHTVYFMSDGERIELAHKASDRRIFADGALTAADWLVAHARAGKPPGLFGMSDVIGMVNVEG